MKTSNGASSLDKTTIVKLFDEVNQGHSNRYALYEQVEKCFNNRCILTYFTSTTQPVTLDNTDVDMIENVLQKSDLSRGLSMVINSLGGDGLAAERIINVCRSYSKGDFEVIVPKMAKSAATMVAFGANKIWMSETSELGPIDPQVISRDGVVSAHNFITSYEELLRKAVATKGNLEPFLQQLNRYDAKRIKNLKASQELADKIAVQALSSGMMKGQTMAAIRKKIKPFTDPTVMSSHGRMIGKDIAKQCGLNIDTISIHDQSWQYLWELYVRIDWCVTYKHSKIVETKDHSFVARAIHMGADE